jgi:hypothetical protein
MGVVERIVMFGRGYKRHIWNSPFSALPLMMTCFVSLLVCVAAHDRSDARLGRVLAAGTGITAFKQVRLGAGSNLAHSKPVVAVLFNPMFHQVRACVHPASTHRQFVVIRDALSILKRAFDLPLFFLYIGLIP